MGGRGKHPKHNPSPTQMGCVLDLVRRVIRVLKKMENRGAFLPTLLSTVICGGIPMVELPGLEG